jgi:N-acetylglutamate synthase
MSALPPFSRVQQIALLQERAARAIPAAVQENRDGCLLRYVDSPTTWWAGAALLHGRGPMREPVTCIDMAHAFYAAHGAPTRIQVCPACPRGLDEALARDGYALESPASLQVADSRHVARHRPPPGLRVDITSAPDPVWLRVLMTVEGDGADAASELRLLERVDQPSAYATVAVSGQPAAVGRAVADTGWAGVFGMATLPEARRQGAGRAALAALADWATAHRCPNLYLQVERHSAGARRLYERAGFEELCTYHYRTAVAR